MRVFVDTSLWVYRLDRRDPDKAARVGRWLRELAGEHEIVVSMQVLVELRAVLTRKFDPPLAPEVIAQLLSVVSAFEVVPADRELVLDAHLLAVREQLAWFDALIVEAAIRNACAVLYSEDLGHGRWYGALRVENPLIAE